MLEKELTWNEFKGLVHKLDSTEYIYRGQASTEWALEPTLARFIRRDNILAKEYYNSFLLVCSDDRIRKHPYLQNFNFSDIEHPIKIGLLYGDSAHKEQMQYLFDFMICLRHLGFPSPFLDWTRNYKVAAFFAASNLEPNQPMAIFRVKTPLANCFDPFQQQVVMSDFDFKTHSRHFRQQSCYTIITQHNHSDTVSRPELRRGMNYLLMKYDLLERSKMEIEKYNITDTGSRDTRINILTELYDEGINLEAIYGDTDLLENTALKDIAFNSLLLKRSVPGDISLRLEA